MQTTIKSKLNPAQRVRLVVIGAGGTGSQLCVKLARLVYALKALGRTAPLDMAIFDFDEVTEANAGRQMFYESDVGENKAVVLARRIEQCFGGSVFCAGFNERFSNLTFRRDSSMQDILISCVDTRRARREIAEQRNVDRVAYHIDAGNDVDYGQVVIGDGSEEMPWPEKAYPNLVSAGPESTTPSCSLAEALEKQDLFVNDWAANLCAGLVWNLLRRGELKNRGAFFNVAAMNTNPLRFFTPVQPKTKRESARKK